MRTAMKSLRLSEGFLFVETAGKNTAILYLYTMTISPAGKHDIPALTELLNSAYRGDVSRKGWTTEADLLDGDLRTDAANLDELMHKPGATFLKCSTPDGNINGCVYLQKQERELYLGMLSVSPLLQAAGIGKQLLAAAIEHAKANDCSSIFMTVISARTELIAWYQRQGYRLTGERKPFPTGNQRFGIPTRHLEFVIMERNLGSS